MFGDRDRVSAAVVGDANPHLAERGLVEAVGACAGRLNELEIRRDSRDFDGDLGAGDYHHLRVAEFRRLVFERQRRIHPPDLDAFRRHSAEIIQSLTTRPIHNYLSAHKQQSPCIRS